MNLQALMKQAQSMQKNIMDSKAKIEAMDFTGESELVTVIMNGKKVLPNQVRKWKNCGNFSGKTKRNSRRKKEKCKWLWNGHSLLWKRLWERNRRQRSLRNGFPGIRLWQHLSVNVDALHMKRQDNCCRYRKNQKNWKKKSGN